MKAGRDLVAPIPGVTQFYLPLSTPRPGAGTPQPVADRSNATPFPPSQVACVPSPMVSVGQGTVDTVQVSSTPPQPGPSQEALGPIRAYVGISEWLSVVLALRNAQAYLDRPGLPDRATGLAPFTAFVSQLEAYFQRTANGGAPRTLSELIDELQKLLDGGESLVSEELAVSFLYEAQTVEGILRDARKILRKLRKATGGRVTAAPVRAPAEAAVETKAENALWARPGNFSLQKDLRRSLYGVTECTGTLVAARYPPVLVGKRVQPCPGALPIVSGAIQQQLGAAGPRIRRDIAGTSLSQWPAPCTSR